MAIENTDTFLVNSGGTSKKVTAGDLVNSTGTLLVNRGKKSYKCDIKDIPNAIKSSDLLLINRGDLSFSVSGQTLLEELYYPDPYELKDLGFTWTNLNPLVGNSSRPSDGVFYNNDPNSGVLIKSETSNGRSEAALIVDLETAYYGRRYKVEYIIYQEWENIAPPGNYQDSRYAISNMTREYRKGPSYTNPGGSVSSTNNVSQKESYEVRNIFLMPNENGYNRYAHTKSLTFRNKTGSANHLAIAGLKLYGYRVNDDGTPYTG